MIEPLVSQQPADDGEEVRLVVSLTNMAVGNDRNFANLLSPWAVHRYIEKADEVAQRLGPRALVLDWGCGAGLMTFLLRRRGIRCVAVDRALPRWLIAPAIGIQPSIVAGNRPLPFEDGAFDAVVNCGVLEHVANPAARLRELHRVLRPEGLLFVYNFPNGSSWIEWIADIVHANPCCADIEGNVIGHERKIPLGDLSQFISAAHFRVECARAEDVLPLTLRGLPASVRSVTVNRVRLMSGLQSIAESLAPLRVLSTNLTVISRRQPVPTRPEEAEPVKRPLIASLRCPSCLRLRKSIALTHSAISTRRLGDTNETETGALTCTGCAGRYEIKGGIVDFLVDVSPEVQEEIDGNSKMAKADRANCDDQWLLGLPGSHVEQRPDMVVHDEEADLRGLMACAGPRWGLRVLDLGAGTCWTTQRWASAGHTAVATDVSLEKYVGLASAETLIRHTGDHFDRVRFDMDDEWPYPDGTFDVVAAVSCLHHAHDLERALGQARRVLKDDGLLLIVETTRSAFQSEREADFGMRERALFHQNEHIYSQTEYARAAKRSGLRIEFKPAPSYLKKVDIARERASLPGRNRMKHRLARAVFPLVPAPLVRVVAAGRLFPAINRAFGTQFIGIAKPSSG